MTAPRVAFNTPEGLEAAEWLVGKSGTVMPTIEQGQGTPDFDTNLFKEGKLAMMHTGIWVFGAVADVPFNWDIAVEPGQHEAGQCGVLERRRCLRDVGEHRGGDQVGGVPHVVRCDGRRRLDAGWELPPISDEAELATYLEKGDPANRQAVFDSLNEIALPPVVAEGQTEMQDIMGEELVEAQAGRKTVQEALDSAEERINAVIGG